MTGYMIVFGSCWCCKQMFTFNPNHVPSLRVKGVKEPVCGPCMRAVNYKREEMGETPHPIHPLAYEAEETV